MIGIPFRTLVDVTGARVLGEARDVHLVGIGTDSRQSRAGELFAALSGPRHEGHRFAVAALERGAAALLLPESAAGEAAALAARVPVALVPDVLDALWKVAAWHRARLAIPVVGITGSCGKTTTKGILARLLSERLVTAASPLSYNNHVGVPLTLFLADERTEALVCEIGTSGSGEIARLTALARPTVGILTNIGLAHLEGLGSLEGVAREKGALAEGLPEGGVFIQDAHCKYAATVRARTRARVVEVAVDGPADFVARDLHFHDGGTSFTLEVTAEWAGGNQREFEVASPLLGTHNVQNLLMALAACRAVGLSLADVLPAVRDLEGGRQRMERHERDGVTVFDDAYNANPSSAAAAVRVLEGLHGFRRRVFVLGEMLELGGDAAALHAGVGREVARAGLDLFVTIGPLARAAAEAVRAAGARTAVVSYEDAAAALAGVPDLIREGDVALVKGSRALRLERLVEAITARFAPAPPRDVVVPVRRHVQSGRTPETSVVR